jgi:hypothetical protein
MKKIILFIFTLSFVQIFSGVKDNLNIFSKSELEEVTARIAQFEKNNNIKFLIETSKYEEEIVIEPPIRTIVIKMNWKLEDNNNNIIKGGSIKNETEVKSSKKMKSISIQQKFTQDLEMEEFSQELNELMDSIEKHLTNKEFKEYILGSINGLEKIIETTKENDQKKIYTKEEIWKFVLILVFFLTFFNILVRIGKKYKNEKK